MSSDSEKGKLLLAHWQKFLKLIKDSHATDEEQKAIWSEFLVIYTGVGLQEGLDDFPVNPQEVQS